MTLLINSQHSNPYFSDLAAMGLTQSVWIVTRNPDTAVEAVTKRGPRPGIRLTKEQAREAKNATNRAYLQAKRLTEKLLRDNVNSSFCTPIAGAAEADKTRRIVARSAAFA